MKKSVAFQTMQLLSIFMLFPLSLLSQDLKQNQIRLNDNIPEHAAASPERETNMTPVWVHYDDVENYDSWGFAVQGELYDVMAKWDAGSLTDYEGWSVTRIKFIVTNGNPFLKVKVWEGPDATEKYSQDVESFNVNSWTEIDLETPVLIDHTKALYIGYEVDMTHIQNGGFVTATDDGPPVHGYGNLSRLDGEFINQYNNHNLRGLLEFVLAADFSADHTVTCDSSKVHFTNLSFGAQSYQWTFEGGTPSTSTLKNPLVTYNIPGEYDVTLEIISGDSTRTEIKEDYIKVKQTPATIQGDTLVCDWSEETYSLPFNFGSVYTWEVINGEIISGQGTNSLTVAWMGAGTGYISVHEETNYDCEGQSGLFQVSIDDCTDIYENKSHSKLVLSPNPLWGKKLYVKKNNNADVLCIISDLNGRIIKKEVLQSDQTTINMDGIPKGIYVLKAIFPEGPESAKIIKY